MIGQPLRAAFEFARAVAVGYGQIFFCGSPVGGFCLFLGLAVVAPRAALAGVAGGMLATLVARARGYPAGAWRSGLYGYGGSLTGIFWGLLFAPAPAAGIALLLAASVSAPLTRLAHRILTPREIPTLALPTLALVWLASSLLEPAPAGSSVAIQAQLLGSGLILVGLASYSRLLCLAALLGAGIGLGVSGALAGGIEPGLVANSALTAVALGGVFLPWSSGALAVAAFGAAAAGMLWWQTAPLLGAWGLPPLVAAFNLVTPIIVRALRVPAIRRWAPGRPPPLPLLSIGRPEENRTGWRERRRLYQMVRNARKICVLTGAGVSTAAGLPDFRGAFGWWAGQDRITLDDLLRSPRAREAYWREEEQFFCLARSAAPAAVHRALAALHQRGRLSAVVTQNVDGLHQAAGLPAGVVIELHGQIHEAHCVDCGKTKAREMLSVPIAAGVTTFYCDGCQGLLKGGSVMFGEAVESERLGAALRALLAADLLLVLGTSLEVAPATDLLRWAQEAAIPIAIVNATPTPCDRDAAVTLQADVGTVVDDLLEETARHSIPPPAVCRRLIAS
ncbi:MAG: urea transporter [Candidatus Methylomirabilia bacterium]